MKNDESGTWQIVSKTAGMSAFSGNSKLKGSTVMIDIHAYLEELLVKLKAAFGDRLLYLGLQGSQRRGEAQPDSDIDIVAVFDKVDQDVLDEYKAIIGTMPGKACGFICGKKELLKWPRHELAILKNDTRDFHGELATLLPELMPKDVLEALRGTAANLRHYLIHDYLFTPASELPRMLGQAAKYVSFILFYRHLLTTGDMPVTKKELRAHISEEEWVLINPGLLSVHEHFKSLLAWSERMMTEQIKILER